MDILIGWYIEPLPTDRILEYTAQALHKFRPFWLEQLDITTLTLLSHFIEDADNYAQVTRIDCDRTIIDSLSRSTKMNCKTTKISLFPLPIKLLLSIGERPVRSQSRQSPLSLSLSVPSPLFFERCPMISLRRRTFFPSNVLIVGFRRFSIQLR